MTSRPLSVRLAPPAGPVGVSLVALDNDRQFTNNPDVNIDVVWPALTRTLSISNDGGFIGATTLPVAARIPWRLDTSVSGRLSKIIYVRFDDLSQTFSDDIVFDPVAPKVQSASLIEGGTAAIAARKKRYRIKLRATDNASGIDRYQIAGKRQASKPRRLRRTSRTVNRTLVVSGSSRPRRIRVRDAAGNWSRWKRISSTRPR